MSARPWLVIVTLAVWMTVLMILVGASLDSDPVPVQRIGPDGPAVTCLRYGQLVPCDP